ncbi:MAG: hypothetical protein MRK00_04535 [Nitrosomonas sp.]|nr:hypothetical protein [Nitrosomonas sp.]
MKRYIKSLVSSLCLFGLVASFNPAHAATTNEIETVFNWAENNFPGLFPSHQATQTIDPWLFRFYRATGIYVGVKNDEVFVLGGPWGRESPTFVEKMPNVLALIQRTNGNGNVPACSNTTQLLEDMVITQSGNVVSITTNGQCIDVPAPENANFCVPPAPIQPTGISVLSTANITSFQTTGITIGFPGIPNPLDSFAQNISTCIANTQADAINLIVNSDICFDVTNQFSSQPSGFGITVNPPITIATISTSSSQQVSDCFATNASSIVDVLPERSGSM